MRPVNGGLIVGVIGFVAALGCQGQGAGNCAKDADCKGERVCVAGQCVDPARPEASAVPVTAASTPASAATAQSQPQPKVATATATAPAQRQDTSIVQFQLNPGGFLIASNLQVDKSGLISSYRQLSQITISNKSSIAAKNVSGEVTWSDSAGKSAGSTTFSTTGVVPAGGSQTFSKSAGTLNTTKLQTKADVAHARIAHADVAE